MDEIIIYNPELFLDDEIVAAIEQDCCKQESDNELHRCYERWELLDGLET